MTPARPSGPLAAFEPAALGQRIRRYAAVAEKNAGALEQLGDQIKPLLDVAKAALDATTQDEALDTVDRVTIIYDRLVKAELNLVKATDELARLQSFLSGGPDSRPDLTSASEIELRAILVEAQRQLAVSDLKPMGVADPKRLLQGTS